MSKIEHISSAPCACGGLDGSTAAALAAELIGLTDALSNLAFDLGGDPDTVRKHMGSLQAIDLITQIHVALAEFLRSEAPIAERISSIPVEDLSSRLAQRLGLSDQQEDASFSGAVEYF